MVRLSGADALDVARAVCDHPRLRGEVESHRAFLAVVRSPVDGAELDEALVLPMNGPDTYTGEDVVEFSCHGGDVTARLVVDACLAAGARAAGPGEFTRRAFLNGRLSLDQAEAVADLIHADDALSARAALGRLRGGLRRAIDDLEGPLLELLTSLEGGLEFHEDEDVGPAADEVSRVLAAGRDRIAALLADADAGRLVRDGVHVVFSGPPNAGKSSLFNALLGESRALVDAEPGTTRDIVSERLVIDGVTFVLHDTAGLRDDAGRVESAGVGKAREAAGTADIVLAVSPLDGEAAPEFVADGVTVIPVGSRCDLVEGVGDGLCTSSVTGEGLDALKQALIDAVDADRLKNVARTGRALGDRHRERLEEALDDLADLTDRQATGAPDEVVATLLAAALSRLGETTGRVYSERLLDHVFSAFCVGK